MDAATISPAGLPRARFAGSPSVSPWSGNLAEDVDYAMLLGSVPRIGVAEAHDGHVSTREVNNVAIFADRRPIIMQTGSVRHLYFLAAGWAYREYVLRDGRRQITDVLVTGDLLGTNVSLSADDAAQIVACGEARVLIVNDDAGAGPVPPTLDDVLERAREAEVRSLRARLVSLGRRHARERVVYFFAEVHARLQRKGLVANGVFTCPLTQEQIADVLGLTAVHVNRTLRRLSAEGVLLVRRPHVVVPDLRRLHDVAGFEGDTHDSNEVGDAHKL